MGKLPEEFADLERFSDWCLASEPERYAKRLASSMEEMQALYDAVKPRARDAIAFCDNYPLDDQPVEVANLAHLLYSLIMVSFPIECFGQPRIPDTGASQLDLLVAPSGS